jgi:flagellar hook-associated protein 3 FlgL
MRVTNQMMAASSLYNINQLKQRTASLSEQVSSGDRFTRVSEDPTAGAEVMRIQSRTLHIKQWESTLTNTKSWVRMTESRLGDVSDLLVRAKELALQGANGALSDESRKALAPAAEQLLEDLLAGLNETEPDGALFGGFRTDGAPFAMDMLTGAVTYSGDTGNMHRDVGPGVTMTANIHGNRLTENLATGWSDPNNMLTSMWNMVQGLKAGDINQVSAVMPHIETARQHMVALRSEMGARDMRIEQLENRMKDMQLQLDGALQQAQGVDMAKALLELNAADTTYRAALQVGANILPQSLADFLR